MDHDDNLRPEAENDDEGSISIDQGMIAKLDQDGETSSIESTPEPDALDQSSLSKDAAPPQKRKGGRKPIYATSEERKQRNRQAQAAFRERRTEYIKQLEATIKQNEETLVTLQQNHRSAADECLMLRYKNSLLERILLEKGIDVQSELQLKAGSPTFPSTSPMIAQSSLGGPHMQASRAQLQRKAIQRHHARRSASTIASSLSGQQQTTPSSLQAAQTFMTSPQTVQTPSSHISSSSDPSASSPHQMHLASGISPTMANPYNQQQQQQQPQQALVAQHGNKNMAFGQSISNRQHMTAQQSQNKPAVRSITRPNSAQHDLRLYTIPPGNVPGDVGTQSASAYYPSPFQKHIDQLEQEYDTENISQSMLDQFDTEPGRSTIDRTPHLNANLRQGYGFQHAGVDAQASQHTQQQLTPHSQDEPGPFTATSTHSPHHIDPLDPTGDNMMHMIDPDDPMLDADPFGLTASMHYTTAYSYEPPPRI